MYHGRRFKARRLFARGERVGMRKGRTGEEKGIEPMIINRQCCNDKLIKPGGRCNILVKNATTFRACLHGAGGPQIGEVTCGGSPHLPGVPHLHVNRPLETG